MRRKKEEVVVRGEGTGEIKKKKTTVKRERKVIRRSTKKNIVREKRLKGRIKERSAT